MSGVINTVTGVLGTTVSSPRACFELCAGTSDAYFTPYLLGGNTLSPRYGCSCGDETVVSGSPSYCGLGSFYAYSHPAAAAASSLPRRKRAIERIQAQKRSEMIRERQWDCPTGMSACNVDGVTNFSVLTLLPISNHVADALTASTAPAATPLNLPVLSTFSFLLLVS